ncbi:MAG: molybdopterin molybdotransferase MoeA [Chloroflexi bacterium]|nr:molybdopterin molybdotransferase MoeA [Chloroflexota bacterium]
MVATNVGMLSVEEAQEKVLSNVRVLEKEERPLLECLGQVLAENVFASIDVPPSDNSAMDGFAVRAESIAGASPSSPKLLRVIAEVAAGHSSDKEVAPDTAIRIMTGAPVPRGADTVVPFEMTDDIARRTRGSADSSQVMVMQELPADANIRRAGEDVRRGSLVLKKDTVLRSAEIGVLASLGRSRVPVIRRPSVAVLATGDEVVDISEPLPPGKIYNSNTYSIAAQVIRYGGIPNILGVAPDQKEALVGAIREGLKSDLLITSGGVSVGDYDVVKNVLATEGEIQFWTVRMKPGKPIAFGVLRARRKAVPHLGLPGNPASSMITFEMFARPAILKMMGKKHLTMSSVVARIMDAVKNTDGRRIFARVKLAKEHGEWVARLTGPQGSGILTSMADANGLAVVPEDVMQVNAGDLVEVLVPDWNEEQF